MQRFERNWRKTAAIFVPIYALATCLYYADEFSLTTYGSRVDISKDWAPYYRRNSGRVGKTDPPRVLLWDIPFGRFPDGLSENVSTRLVTCPQQCIVSYDRTMLMSSDAVVFHGPEVRFYDSPKWRAAHQKWVFWSQEPPPPVGSLKGVFNWTMTYRSDSDIWNPYGIIAERKTKQSYQYQQTWKIWRRKSRMAAWAVSRCEARSRREDYVNQLRKYVRVNVYGTCGQLKCPRANSTRCYEMFEEKYFFYLSFENSICRDYVTEKFFNVLEYDIVPVVLGGANYTAIAPPDSFIDALSFRSPKHLAEYLKRVAGDFQLYAKYLRWKETHTLANFPRFDALCRVCKKLHSPSFRQTTVVADMFHWWNTMSHCWSWNFTN